LCSDIDFEYPASIAEGQAFANLFTELRTAFDALAEKKGDTVPYQLTVCTYPLDVELLLICIDI
jgi:GH18 family chitinase